MDRTDRLEKMLPTWAKIESIKDIVVVDWSSKIPIIENENIKKILQKFNKIKIVRVENEKFFHICKSNNIAFRFTNQENKILLKLDVDYVNIDESWMDYLTFTENEDKSFILKQYFLVGSYRFYQSSSGFLLVNKKDFKSVKGYNENYSSGWGGDDSNLYKRIYKNKKTLGNKFFEKILFFDIKRYIYHIPHDDELRHCNYPPEQKKSKKNKEPWEFQKYKVLSQKNNYIRIELKNKFL